MSQRGDIAMPEGSNAVRMLMGILGMLEGLAGLLMPRQVILLTVLLGHAMSMRGVIVQVGGALVALVLRAVVKASGHLERRHLTGLGVSFPGQPVRMIGVLERPLGVPASGFVVAFFMMFGSRTVGMRRQFVLVGGLPVLFVHMFPPVETVFAVFLCARGGPIAEPRLARASGSQAHRP